MFRENSPSPLKYGNFGAGSTLGMMSSKEYLVIRGMGESTVALLDLSNFCIVKFITVSDPNHLTMEEARTLIGTLNWTFTDATIDAGGFKK